MIQTEHATVHIGNNLDILPTLPDNSVDSIVTDPPYELGFMGKKWDSSGIAYSVELWKECLRVLKPGGHLLSFGGTRTWHRVAVAIEDAGFEVRDSIAWMYGSGFPKSLDVSKAIDKGTGENKQRRLRFVEWMKSTGMTASQANKILQEARAISPNGTMAGHFFETVQPAIATADLFDRLRPYLPEVPEEIERLVAERTGIEWTAYKNREVIGSKMSGIANKEEKERHTIGASKAIEVDITAPATPEAKQWEGWGTALKPAFEPIVVARKPLIGTVAENVLTHGTGGLNIDGSRIGTEERTNKGMSSFGVMHDDDWQPRDVTNTVQGRWPANVILDEYSAEILDEQSGIRPGETFPAKRGQAVNTSFASGQETVGGQRSMGDTGGASRFFYVAKASKRDRNEGLEDLADTTAGNMVDREENSAGMNSPRAGAGRTSGAKNFHPTVKPTTLMTYLIKLVTPPGGTVLDPFTGSGSTGKGAILEGFRFIGCELTEDYIPIIEGRLLHAEAERKATEAKKDEALF